jgi:hypothetical protein
MKKISIILTGILFINSLIFSQMPSGLTSIHKLGTSFSKFQKNNPQYKVDNNFLIRNKPDLVNDSWNYDKIIVEGNDSDKIVGILFRIYDKTTKQHIKNPKALKELLSNQFKAGRYQVKGEEAQELLGSVLNNEIFLYVSNNITNSPKEIILLTSDQNKMMVYFEFEESHYIYLCYLPEKIEKTISETDNKKEEPADNTPKESKAKDASSDSSSDKK